MDTAVLTLSEFVLARIAEDEAAASAVHHRDCRIYRQLTIADCDCVMPDRVLAECEAKRRVVEDWASFGRPGDYGRAMGLGHAVKVLAAVYSDHPDYRPEWRP